MVCKGGVWCARVVCKWVEVLVVCLACSMSLSPHRMCTAMREARSRVPGGRTLPPAPLAPRKLSYCTRSHSRKKGLGRSARCRLSRNVPPRHVSRTCGHARSSSLAVAALLLLGGSTGRSADDEPCDEQAAGVSRLSVLVTCEGSFDVSDGLQPAAASSDAARNMHS